MIDRKSRTSAESSIGNTPNTSAQISQLCGILLKKAHHMSIVHGVGDANWQLKSPKGTSGAFPLFGPYLKRWALEQVSTRSSHIFQFSQNYIQGSLISWYSIGRKFHICYRHLPPVDLHWFFEISIRTEKKFQLELKKFSVSLYIMIFFFN